MNQLDVASHEGSGDVSPTRDGMVLRTRSKFSATFNLPVQDKTQYISVDYWFLLRGRVSITLMLDDKVIESFERGLDDAGHENHGFPMELVKPGTHTLTLSIEALEKKPVEVTIKEVKFLSGGRNAHGSKQAATQSGKS